MILHGTGGANTRTGLHFETRSSLLDKLEGLDGYRTDGTKIIYKGRLVAQTFKKRGLYSKFFELQGINWKDYISKRLEPDCAVYVATLKTLHIVEMKFQQTEGSVDEKLQTCDFKRKQYLKLATPLGIKVEFTYLLSAWFRKDSYKDVLEYIEEMGCHYYFEDLPLLHLGLPDPLLEQTPSSS